MTSAALRSKLRTANLVTIWTTAARDLQFSANMATSIRSTSISHKEERKTADGRHAVTFAGLAQQRGFQRKYIYVMDVYTDRIVGEWTRQRPKRW